MNHNIDFVHVGRVFFEPESGPDVEKVTVLTLESHVANVVRLVENFRRDFYSNFNRNCHITREFLIRAACKHDAAKPETFRVTYRSSKHDAIKSLGYSFAGHRFRVFDVNRYVEQLIRLHHEFSVEGIAKAQAQLSTLKQFSQTEVENFPIDLYILEMCDQIEAELETYAFTDGVQPRVFMDFHSRRRNDKTIEVSPYPFGPQEICLALEYYEFNVPEKHKNKIRNALKNDKPTEGQRLLREIIVKAHTYTECQRKEMILCKTY